MKIETISDIIDWTRQYHELLSRCLAQAKDENLAERARLLLDYLAKHEHQLSLVLQGFEDSDNLKALHTWCYDYLDKYPVKPHPACDKPYAKMSTGEIIKQVEYENGQILALYRHVRSRVDSPSAIELIEQLISLEEHEAMRMAHSANRLEDL
ncbi:MAG: ATPase [Pseudomonadales bacterium]